MRRLSIGLAFLGLSLGLGAYFFISKPQSAPERARVLLDHRPPGDAKVYVLGDGFAAAAIDASGLRHAVSYAAEGLGPEGALSILELALARGGSPLCVLAAFSFQSQKSPGSLPVRDPAIDPRDLAALKAMMLLAAGRGIPFIWLKIPFSASSSPEAARRYWLKYEEILYAVEAPFRLLAPLPFPEAEYAGAGLLNRQGAARMTSFLSSSLGACYR